MAAVFTIAGLTVKEAIRRRFVYAGIVISLFFLILVVIPIHPHRAMFFSPAGLLLLIAQMISMFGGHIAEFFAFLFAIALSAGTISNEIERGVLSVILPKPIGRWSVYCGKWLGVNLFVIPCLFLWVCLLQLAIFHHTHAVYTPLWRGFLVMSLYPIVFSSVTLFFSSFTSNLLAIVLPLIVAAIAWSEGFLKYLGYSFNDTSIIFASKAVVYVAPLSPMSRWVQRALDPTILIEMNRYGPKFGPPEPLANNGDLVWILGYALVFFVAGLAIFQRRDI